MARLPEQRLWDKIRAAILPRGIFARRIENLVDVGMPDLMMHAPETGAWMAEMKAVEGIPARARTPLLGEAKGLSIEQRNWLLEYTAAGGKSLVILGVGSGLVFAIDGARFDEVNKLTYAQWIEGAASDSAEGLADLLCTHWSERE